jgi:hypothetical protein
MSARELFAGQKDIGDVIHARSQSAPIMISTAKATAGHQRATSNLPASQRSTNAPTSSAAAGKAGEDVIQQLVRATLNRQTYTPIQQTASK